MRNQTRQPTLISDLGSAPDVTSRLPIAGANLPPSAFVFLRPSGANNAGHVGWGFVNQANPRDVSVGAVENPHDSTGPIAPDQMGFWTLEVANPFVAMSGPPHWQQWQSRYDLVKVIPVATPNFDAAKRAVAVVSRHPWVVATRNCMNDVYDVLVNYGTEGLPNPSLPANWIPTSWWNAIQGRVLVITNPVSPIDATLYEDIQFGGRRYYVYNPGGCADLGSRPAPGQPNFARIASSLVVRSGFIAFYAGPNFSEAWLKLKPGEYNSDLTKNGWNDRIRSYFASKTDFDPGHLPTLAGLEGEPGPLPDGHFEQELRSS